MEDSVETHAQDRNDSVDSAAREEAARDFDKVVPLVFWVYETLEKATEVADSRMSKKEGLVLLILYKREGSIETGDELEQIFRNWNDAHRSDRVIEDLGFALGRLLRGGKIQAQGLSEAEMLSDDPLEKKAITLMRNIALTKDGWFRVGAMRAVIHLRLENAQEKFGGSAQEFIKVVKGLEMPPMTVVEL